MKSFVDIHTHILPAVDDGSPDLESSMEMLRRAESEGIGGIILTPHFKPMHHNAGPEKIRQLGSTLQKKAMEEGMHIRLFSGNEFYYHEGIFDRLEAKQACTLAGSDYILIEYSPAESFLSIRNGLYQAQAAGYLPILAHAERYQSLQGKTAAIEELYRMGVYIQINAGSVMGRLGFGIRSFTGKLLKERLVHFVASDAHNPDRRAPRLKDCAERIAKKYGREYMQELLCENPRRILQNEVI